MESSPSTNKEDTLKNTSPSLKKALIAAKAAIDKKAENVKILDLSQISGFTDFFVICSAISDRQVKTISEEAERKVKEEGERPLSVEGQAEGRWVLIDFGDVVMHVFLDAIRDYYDLESLWCDARAVPIPKEFYAPAASQLIK